MNDLRILRDRQAAAADSLDRQAAAADPYGSAAHVRDHDDGDDLPDIGGGILCLQSRAADRLGDRGSGTDIHGRYGDGGLRGQPGDRDPAERDKDRHPCGRRPVVFPLRWLTVP